jgi:hypothetical protein
MGEALRYLANLWASLALGAVLAWAIVIKFVIKRNLFFYLINIVILLF